MILYNGKQEYLNGNFEFKYRRMENVLETRRMENVLETSFCEEMRDNIILQI